MKVVKENNYNNVFPMKIICHQVVDEDGYTYGKKNDFCGSELEIEAEDIKKHTWYKYPDYSGVDYGVVCPMCGKFVVVDTGRIPIRVLNDAKEISVS